MNRLLAVSGKHPLEYDIWYETAMPQDIKKERERLDSITNLPDANDRETLNPKKVEIRLQEKEKAEKASLRAYKMSLLEKIKREDEHWEDVPCWLPVIRMQINSRMAVW